MTRSHMTHSRRRIGGFTLLETTFSVSILAIVAGGTVSMMKSSGSVFTESVRSTAARRASTDALARLTDDVAQANAASLAITTNSTAGDQLSLQVPMSITAGTVTWGARTLSSGTVGALANSTVRYLVTAAPAGRVGWQLVRRVVNSLGATIGSDEVLLRDVDGPDQKLGKGFVVTRNNKLVTVTVRMRMSSDKDVTDKGEDLIKTRTLTIRLNN